MKDFEAQATEARKHVLKLTHKAQSCHIGSNLSCIDIMAVLFDALQEKDKFILSKTWAAASLYHFLAKKGVLDEKELDEKYGEEPYLGLADPNLPGVEYSGSMGHGLPASLGFALAQKRGDGGRTFCLMSDGEVAIGTTWETAAIASHHKLDNLKVIIDYNQLQAMGETNEILNIEPLKERWEAFGWEVLQVDGHDFNELDLALRRWGKKPIVVIAHTIKGKGISFMEGKLEWHYWNVTDEVLENAMKEL